MNRQRKSLFREKNTRSKKKKCVEENEKEFRDII